jgi:hypothetical protein
MTPARTDPATVGSWLGDRLAEENIPYAIGGAVALAAHGIPRNTADVDLSVFVPEDELDRLFDALERAGCLFERAHALAMARKINLFTVRNGHVNADLFVAFHPHHHEALARRVELRCPDGRARWFQSAEDLVIHKLALARPKDFMDLELLFAARGASLDLTYVRRWVSAIVGAADSRLGQLEALERRFVTKP